MSQVAIEEGVKQIGEPPKVRMAEKERRHMMTWSQVSKAPFAKKNPDERMQDERYPILTLCVCVCVCVCADYEIAVSRWRCWCSVSFDMNCY